MCDRGFGEQEAAVACRMLGLTGGKVLAGGSFGQANVPHKLDWVDCTGAEVSLTQCKYNVRPSCGDHRHDVGVECTTPPDLSVRLVGSTDPLQGRLEVGKECERGQGQSAVAGCTASHSSPHALPPCRVQIQIGGKWGHCLPRRQAQCTV